MSAIKIHEKIKRTKPCGLLKRTRFLWRNKPYHPSHFMVLSKDWHNNGIELNESEDCSNTSMKHVEAIFLWLCFAHDVNRDGGVAGFYRFDKGWSASYPETTGYIIPTFFNYYHYTGIKEYRDRAIQMSDWEISIQMDSGAFQGCLIDIKREAEVFNTGQILGGLIRTYDETKDNQYLNSAIRTGDWLVKVQDDDGSWSKHTYVNLPRTYHSRVAWFLLELYQHTKDDKYLQSGIKQLDWGLKNQLYNGFFSKCAFYDDSLPFTHTIAYAIRGFLESGLILDHKPYVKAAIFAAEKLMDLFESDGFLYGFYDEEWGSHAQYTCLTGNAQTAIIWLKIHELTNDVRYLNSAHKINNYLKSLHDLKSGNRGIMGGIKGSHPIWGGYMPYRYPNWAAKFLADSLMLEEKINSNPTDCLSFSKMLS